MKHIRSFSCAVLAASIVSGMMWRTASAAPQTSSPEPTAGSIEERLEAIEKKLRLLEERLLLVQNSGQPTPDSSASVKSGASQTGVSGAAADIAAQIEALDQKIRIVDRKRELEQEDAAAKAREVPVLFAGEDGFVLRSNKADYRLAIGMTAQTDGRFSLDDPKPITNTFTIRKIRPTLTGRVANYFEFKVMPDFGNGTTIIQDAYFDIRFTPAFRIRIGKDKTPVGYELLQGDSFLLFPERALASSLVPNRDIGVQVQGDLMAGKLYYAAGVFNGVPDGTSSSSELDNNGSKDLAGRVVFQPFKSATTPGGVLDGLGFQMGGTNGRQIGALPSFRTSVGQTYFSYDSTSSASGERNRISPAVFYYYKAFGAFGEYMRSTQGVTRSGKQTSVTNQAWEVTGSYLLTGETATDRGVRPKHNFDPVEGRWGALQILGRYTVLTVDRDVFLMGLAAANTNRQAKSFTVGANWYPVAFIKVYGTFERTVFINGNSSRPPENVILFRTQLAF